MSPVEAVTAPSPSPKRRSRKRTTVVTFKADLTRTTYRFNSRPDYRRIGDEAKADDMTVALVFPGYSEKDRGTVIFLSFADDTPTFFPRSKTPALLSVIHAVLGTPGEKWHRYVVTRDQDPRDER